MASSPSPPRSASSSARDGLGPPDGGPAAAPGGLGDYRRSAELGVLLRTPELVAAEWTCAGRQPVAEERAAAHEIVFVLAGAFAVETERGRGLADSSLALILPRGTAYRVSHPAGCADRCLFFALEAPALEQLLSAVASPLMDHPERLLARLTVACPPGLALERQRFAAAARRASDDGLATSEAAIALLGQLLAGPPRGEPAPGARVRRQRRERVEAVRVEVHRRLGDASTLSDLARAVHCSPFHLAREFRAVTGQSIHQYRLRLRLEASLDRLRGGERDLTRLALDLGFFDHAHFSAAFRRRFGAAPSTLRRSLAS